MRSIKDSQENAELVFSWKYICKMIQIPKKEEKSTENVKNIEFMYRFSVY